MNYLVSHFAIFLFCGLIYVYGLLSSSVQNKFLKLYFIIYILIICFFAYYFNPFPSQADLSRHFKTLEAMQNISLNRFFDLVKNENLKGSYSLFYFVSKTGNFHILPVISVIIVYGNMFYILYKEIILNNLDGYKKSTLILFCVICLNFIASISGIRNYIGLSIFAISTYADLRLKKNKIIVFLGYFASMLFHESLVALLIIRIVFMLYNKRYSKIFFSLVLCLIVYILLNMDLLSTFSEGDYSDTLFRKYGYYEEHGIGRIIMIIALMINITLILIQLLYLFKIKNIFNNKYLLLIFFMIIFEIIMPFFSYQIFTRFFNYLLVIFIPISAIFVNKLYNSCKSIHNTNFVIKTLLFILLGVVYFCYGYSNYSIIFIS